MNKVEKIALGMAFGTLVGAIGGLLLAPQSGKETREVLQDKIDRVKTGLEGTDESAREQPDRDANEA